MFGRSTLLQVYETSGGNPFFALELARALERLPPPAAGEPLPVPAQLEALLARRLADLPSRTVEVLRLGGALARPTLELVETAAGSDAGTALRPAIEAGLVALDGDHVRFTHPLFPLAVASQLTPDERRELHGRLPAVVDDFEQRARHLALATEGPDAEVAAALEAAAEAAAALGGWAAAAELYELAAARTPRGAPEGSHRRLRASGLWDEVGDDARALSLVEPLAPELPPGPERARGLMLLSYLLGDYAQGVKLGEEALLQPGLGDALARRSITSKPTTTTCSSSSRLPDHTQLPRSSTRNGQASRPCSHRRSRSTSTSSTSPVIPSPTTSSAARSRRSTTRENGRIFARRRGWWRIDCCWFRQQRLQPIWNPTAPGGGWKGSFAREWGRREVPANRADS
jgi:tetratricopeptide (TPR) repeat protein